MDAAQLIAKVPTLATRSDALNGNADAAATAADDAVIDAIALSACADGVTSDELVVLIRMAHELPTLRGQPAEAVDARVRASFDRIQEDGLEGRLEKLADATLDDDLRRRIFCAAAIVQYTDGHVTNEENELLLDLADVLGLDETRVRAIVDEIEQGLAT